LPALRYNAFKNIAARHAIIASLIFSAVTINNAAGPPFLSASCLRLLLLPRVTPTFYARRAHRAHRRQRSIVEMIGGGVDSNGVTAGVKRR
jgi:hypothetical protein